MRVRKGNLKVFQRIETWFRFVTVLGWLSLFLYLIAIHDITDFILIYYVKLLRDFAVLCSTLYNKD